MTRKKFIAFSGGVESTSMCVLFGKEAQPVFTDTKFEHDLLYHQIDKVEAAIGVPILRITAKNVDGRGVDSLEEYIRLRKFYPNNAARFCTRLFKIEPMDNFLREQGDCELMIGLNADEADEREGNYGECKNVHYSYPLIESGYTRTMCEELLEKVGLHPCFPAYMRRGGCKGCFFKSKKEYEAMALLSPKEALEVAELEEAIQDKRGTHFSIHQSIPNMREFVLNARQAALFPAKEMYGDRAPDGKGCGVFCHR